MTLHPDWLRPAWDGPVIGAVMTTRAGGASRAPFDAMNLRDGIGDAATDVQRNRERFVAAIGAAPVWIEQVHGHVVARVGVVDALPGARMPVADACVTTETGVACCVQVADCLPVLFAAPRGVGAAHAGWRGLAAGVLEATVETLCDAADCPPCEVRAWIGPGIGPTRFEVGEDVRRAFGADVPGDAERHFVASGTQRWHADLVGLARDRLAAAGVGEITGGHWCTASDASRFFSFRRDGRTGRMAAAVWRRA